MAKNSFELKRMFHTKIGLLLSAVLFFGLSYLVFLRASDTGSLQQYFALIVIVFLGLNRLIRLARVLKNGQTTAS